MSFQSPFLFPVLFLISAHLLTNILINCLVGSKGLLKIIPLNVHNPNIFRKSIHTWDKQQESLSYLHLSTCKISNRCVNRSPCIHVFIFVNLCFGYQTPTCCSALSSRAFSFLQYSGATNLLRTWKAEQDAKKDI